MSTWDEPDPGELRRLSVDADWSSLVEKYAAGHPRPFARCLEVARVNAATSVLVETRYIDADYRSEYSAYYQPGDLPTPNLPWTNVPAVQPTPAGDTRLVAVMCRHLSSGFPVMVAASGHAFNIVGWIRDAARTGWIRFVRHDDQRGPYLWVDDLFADTDPATGHDYGTWNALIVPLPAKVWLPPENAEEDAYAQLAGASAAVAPHLKVIETIPDLVANGRLALRTFACTSSRFKNELAHRRFDPAAEEELRTARMSRRIWVVEAIDRQARAAGLAPVLGEVVYDATSAELDPRPLSVRIHGCLWIHQTATGGFRGPIVTSPAPVLSAGIGPS